MTATAAGDQPGRTALVTGSSRGIGHAFALGLARAGYRVTVHGRERGTVDAAAAAVRDAVGPDGPTVGTAVFDVTDPAAVAAGVAGVDDAVGGLDVLVNNVGTQLRKPLLEVTDGEWDRVLATTLTAAFTVGREAARRMVPRGAGCIVNVGSLQCEVTRPGITPYATAKGGLKMLTRGMCADWAGSGLRVNAIGPGYVATEMTRALWEDPDFDGWVRRHTPAGRWARVEDLVGPLLFLVSDAASFVHGQVLYVDGGMTTVL